LKKPYLEKYIGPHTLYGNWTQGRLDCAQFVIDKSIIQRNPKQMYIDLYNWVLQRDTTNPGILQTHEPHGVGSSRVAWVLEWTWDLIFISDQLIIKK
jgi:hypothetical protein